MNSKKIDFILMIISNIIIFVCTALEVLTPMSAVTFSMISFICYFALCMWYKYRYKKTSCCKIAEIMHYVSEKFLGLLLMSIMQIVIMVVCYTKSPLEIAIYAGVLILAWCFMIAFIGITKYQSEVEIIIWLLAEEKLHAFSKQCLQQDLYRLYKRIEEIESSTNIEE